MKSRVFGGLYVCRLVSASVVPTDAYILSKYCTSVQLDQQQKHSAPFVNSFSNPTGESGAVHRFKLALSLADKRYINNNGFHR